MGFAPAARQSPNSAPPSTTLPTVSPTPSVNYDLEVVFSEPADTLPALLPSVEDIETSADIEERWGRSTVRFSDAYFIKFGAQVEEIEATTLQYVKQQTDLIVPQVYAVYRRRFNAEDRRDRIYIIMATISGDSLDKIWDNFDDNEKARVTSQLRECVA